MLLKKSDWIPVGPGITYSDDQFREIHHVMLNWSCLSYDIGIGLGILVALAILSESIIRRREARKP